MAVTDVTEKTFVDEVLMAPGLVIVDYWADWCAPCKQMAPVIEELSEDLEGKALFGKERQLYVGTEINMWRAKYGVKPVDGSGDRFDQTAVQALVKYHF